MAAIMARPLAAILRGSGLADAEDRAAWLLAARDAQLRAERDMMRTTSSLRCGPKLRSVAQCFD